jgi:F-type H+-transporting ATPase subunit delta
MTQTSDRYAKALFELSKEQNILESVQAVMTDVRKIILDSEEFRYFLKNPLLSYDDRCVVLKALFEGKVPGLYLTFLYFITYKSRLNILKDIIESFDSLYLISTNQLRVYVTTALPIEKADEDFIGQRLHDKFQRNVLTRWKINPSFIGGFRIFVEGKIYDYSFKSQLDHFFQQTTQKS